MSTTRRFRTAPPRAVVIPAAAVLLTCLAACSTGQSGSRPTGQVSVPTTVTAAPTPIPSTSAAAGSITSADGSFSVVAPSGWKKFHSAKSTLSLKAPRPQDKVTTALTVVVQAPEPVPALDDVVTQAEIAWRQQGVKISDEPDRTIGGLPASGYTFTRTAQGAQFTQTQFFVVYREHIYSLTMTSAASATASAGARQALDGILSTWAWQER